MGLPNKALLALILLASIQIGIYVLLPTEIFAISCIFLILMALRASPKLQPGIFFEWEIFKGILLLILIII